MGSHTISDQSLLLSTIVLNDGKRAYLSVQVAIHANAYAWHAGSQCTACRLSVHMCYIVDNRYCIKYLNYEFCNCRCTDPVDVVMSDDVTVAESLKMPNKYAMVGYIVMKDADSAQYVMQASQTVRLLLTNEVFIDADVVSISFKNRIEYFSNLSMEHVPIALNKVSTANFKAYCIGHQRDTSKPVTKIKVNFHIKHRYFQDLHHAVDNLPQLMIQKLFPSAAITKRNFKQDDNNFVTLKKLQAPFEPDKLQLETISSMLSVSADAPFLLVGPFGTGKTHVLACAAAAIVNEDASAKVLIATHHNKSADTFVSKYFGTLESTKTLPPTVAPVRIASNFIDDMDKPYLVRFNDPTITKELLDERRIVVTTFLTALHFANTEKLPRGYFSHILIDEGAQTREPETIAPLIFGDKNTKVIIAGDHLQVKNHIIDEWTINRITIIIMIILLHNNRYHKFLS